MGCFSYANVNGYLSAPIYLSRGLHQGSPLSPVLFLLIAQIFSSRLDQSQDISGLSINGIEILLSLFADDTDLFLQSTKQCIDAVFEELQQFGTHSGCKANISKTSCTPLGKTKVNLPFLEYITEKYGDEFVNSSFSALGVNFNNSDSINDISNNNFTEKLDKARSVVDLWSKRDLTLFGKTTIIRSLLFSQFTYLVLPLPRPSSIIIKNIETLIFHFLWGCKRDKISRDVVKRRRQEGGLGIFAFSDFIRSLKLTLFNKMFNNTFTHAWKNILVAQLAYPDYLQISIENCMLRNNSFEFTRDLLECYKECKVRAVDSCLTFDSCIWGNKEITGLWNKILWNDILIKKNIIYISDIIDVENNNRIMSYENFCVKYNLSCSDISKDYYSNIKLAIRDYKSHTRNVNDYCLFDEKTVLARIMGGVKIKKPIKGRQIRDLLSTFKDPNMLTPLKEWCKDLNNSTIDWVLVLIGLHAKDCNNFKLLQFQYKLLMRISTCKYMRVKMGISQDTPMCSLCNSHLETLPHIFLKCYHTLTFRSVLQNFICGYIDPQYRDSKSVDFITSNHGNKTINYVNIAAKWYISKQFQSGHPLLWDGFKKYLRLALNGEKLSLRDNLLHLL